jgi:hypothetical protein
MGDGRKPRVSKRGLGLGDWGDGERIGDFGLRRQETARRGREVEATRDGGHELLAG